MNLGERLQEERNKLEITQSEVAEKLKVSRQTISNWETGKSYPDLESLITLSDYYNISLDVLLKEDSGMVEDIKKKLKFVGLFKMMLYLFLIGFTVVAMYIILDYKRILMIPLYWRVGLISKIILVFLFLYFSIKSLNNKESKNYKILFIITIFYLFHYLIFGNWVNVAKTGNEVTWDTVIVYLVLILFLGKLYFITSNIEKY